MFCNITPYKTSYNDLDINSSLRIAIHISGDIRSNIAIESINSKIINYLSKKFNIVDVFIYCSNQHDMIRFNNIVLNYTEQSDQSQIKNIMWYRMLILQEEFENYCSINNKKYDIVIRLRPDIILPRNIDQKYILLAQGQLVLFDRFDISTSPSVPKCTDTIFLGPPNIIRDINRIYLLYRNCSNPELLLMNYILYRKFIYNIIQDYQCILSNNHMSRLNIIRNFPKYYKTLNNIYSTNNCYIYD